VSKIAIINCSSNVYNFATAKMVNKFRAEGHEVFVSSHADMWARQCDRAYLSAIFTYDLPALVTDVNNLLMAGVEVEIGGPGPTALPQYVAKTGITPHVGLDERFEHIPGDNYEVTFTSRGCPRACSFCIVSRMEGRQIIEYDEFPIPSGQNPKLGDNNLLLTSWAHQELVVKKLKGVPNLDYNSGFDDRIFIKNPERYWQLYNELDLECWRFAYDSPEQREAIRACSEFLHSKGVDYRHIIVFCLIGGPGSDVDTDAEKLTYLIDLGTSCYPMRYKPLDCLTKTYDPPGWEPKMIDKLFNWGGVPWHWRTVKWPDFKKQAKLQGDEWRLL